MKKQKLIEYEKGNDDFVMLEIISGVEGECVSLNDFRICGPKPWGGGTVTKRWKVEREYLKRALGDA